jgi:drug/metabolite transporter (DMT)-like permease
MSPVELSAIFTFLNVVLSVVGDSAGKMWAVNSNFNWLLAALLINTLTQLTFVMVVRYNGLAAGSTLLLLCTLVGNVAIGLFVFHEKLGTSQAAGLILGIVAISLVANVF